MEQPLSKHLLTTALGALAVLFFGGEGVDRLLQAPD